MQDMTPKDLGSRLRLLRVARGLTAYQVAAGIFENEDRYYQILKWEAGKHRPSKKNLELLSHFFLVDLTSY